MGIGPGRRPSLGPGLEVKPLQDGRGLSSTRTVELLAAAVDDDERGNALDTVAFSQLRGLVDVDRSDRVSVLDQGLDGWTHLPAWPAPVGMKVEQNRVRL